MTTLIIAVGSPESNQRWADVFAQLAPKWQIVCWDQVGHTVEADFAVVWRPSIQLFKDQPRLQAIFNIGAGVDGIDFTQVPDSVPVYRVEDAGMAVQMAEYAVYGAMLATQRFMPYVDQQYDKKWEQQEPIYKTEWPVGVMGYGKIGEKVAQTLQLLGYPVSVWVRSERPSPDGMDLFFGSRSLPSFLEQSRILINVLPLTDETRGIVNNTLLAQLPPQSFFINMARGPHVVDEDLLAAIDHGHLSGALLDVFHVEPLPQDHPFWTHPAIHVTPHISGVSLREPTAQQIQAKIQLFLQNQPVSGLVERERMY
ncbi:glyoxylate/hydroxypyruvate reductase A [uncultured Paenalcaligenes sp.]|uniref:2-hydroxyacid dehydrogenase n=1 Tax=uncultured Paenalcaligenes sp. TaxID=1588925 RepID=UPI00261C308B|nr:glyoxylate/hydroxypyruvate reductase A [uncultured Paenalcaligenes sp.]